jgi:hypothetical protein
VEAAAEVIPDAAGGQSVERRGQDAPGAEIPGPRVHVKAELQRHRLRELRRAPEAAVIGIENVAERAQRRARQLGSEAARHTDLQAPGHLLQDLAGRALAFLAALGVGLRRGVQHARKPRPAEPIARREVRAPVVRPPGRRAEDRRRPAALPGHHLDGGHVDLVEVRPFLAIDLDIDEALVHERGDFRILERLVGHHVAPVAGRIADRQEDGPILGTRAPQGVGSPGIPVHRVVGVLPEVGAPLPGQPVGQTG